MRNIIFWLSFILIFSRCTTLEEQVSNLNPFSFEEEKVPIYDQSYEESIARFAELFDARGAQPSTNLPIKAIFPFETPKTTSASYYVVIREGCGVELLRSSDLRSVSLGALGGPCEKSSLSSSRAIIVAGDKNLLTLYTLPDLKKLQDFDRAPGSTQSIHMNPYEKDLVIANADGRVYRWAWTIEQDPSFRGRGRFAIERYIKHGSVVSAVRYHPIGRVFLSGDWNGRVIAWKAYDEDPYEGQYDANIFGTGFFTDQSSLRLLPGTSGGRVELIRFGTKGEQVLIAFDTGEIEMWTVRGLKKEFKVKAHRGSIRQMAVNRATEHFLSYGRDERLVVNEIVEKYDPLLDQKSYNFKAITSERMPGVRAIAHRGAKEFLLGFESGEVKAYRVPDASVGSPAEG